MGSWSKMAISYNDKYFIFKITINKIYIQMYNFERFNPGRRAPYVILTDIL